MYGCHGLLPKERKANACSPRESRALHPDVVSGAVLQEVSWMLGGNWVIGFLLRIEGSLTHWFSPFFSFVHSFSFNVHLPSLGIICSFQQYRNWTHDFKNHFNFFFPKVAFSSEVE